MNFSNKERAVCVCCRPFLINQSVMAKGKTINQPNKEEEKLLNDIVENRKDEIVLRGRKWKVGWMHNRAIRKVTDIQFYEKDERKVSSKCAAALLLNGYWKILFFYWFLWRWFFYVMQYSDRELIPVIALCKKKVQVEEYCAVTMLLTEMKDTIMMMTREEVERIRQESFMAQRGRSVKSTDV